jgi:thiaminase/transcriptional activator TenA
MPFSKDVWDQTQPIYQAILQHPFNQELMRGTLGKDKFAFYIEQDIVYLRDFSRCHALIASKAPLEHVRSFLGYADYVLIAEQEVVHQFFKQTFSFEETGVLSPATMAYTNYLLRMCSLESWEIGLAAILPCLWIYREVGLHIAKNAVPNNPYARWIETYAGEEFSQGVDKAISIFNEVASNTDETTRQKMQDAYLKSSILEWHFWNDAYEKRNFASLTL